MTEEKLRVLVVDDDPDTLLYLCDLLATEGFWAEGSSSALHTLDYIRSRSPEVVIADVRMPEMDGLELLRQIKEVRPKTRVILVSAFGDEKLRTAVMEGGGEGLLMKPLAKGALVRALEREAGGAPLGARPSPGSTAEGPPPGSRATAPAR
jgi:DNA-binding response OmpR family regulator